MALGRSVACAVLLLSLVFVPEAARSATAEEGGFLSLYFSEDELEVFSATRSLKSVASIAENVAVVTAEDIALKNAHTVAEAIYNVTGVEMADFKGPGSGGIASIHGSGLNRVTVMLDGVPLSTANNDFPLSRLPVQMIRKIEIIKGPASSTWGSSFGGIINVITKSAEASRKPGGTAYASYGEEDTSDLRAELFGGSDRLGFYLAGSRMESDGVQDDHGFTHKDFLGKASVSVGSASRLELSFYYHDSDSTSLDLHPLGRDIKEGFDLESRYGKADFWTSLAAGVDLQLSAWTLRQDDNLYLNRRSDDLRLGDRPTSYDRYGFSGDITWRTGRHVLVAGADFMDGDFEHDFEPRLEIDQQEYGLFLNDTITAGKLCATPGLRYDHSNLAGGVLSPSLGVTYLASRDLLFRALVSRGFHDPSIVKYYDAPPMGYFGNADLDPEIIWSYQAGLEANVSNLLRAKLTLFHHDIDDILVERVLLQGPGAPVSFTSENGGSARTTGGELELTTNRFRGWVLEAGASYEHIDLSDFTDPRVEPKRDVYGFNAAATYDAGKGFRAAVEAHYFWWDAPDLFRPDSDGIVVDANLIQEVLRRGRFTLDAFFTAHNIFDESSYADFLQQNPDRWVEGGVRCSF